MNKLSCSFKEFKSFDEWDKEDLILVMGCFLSKEEEINSLYPFLMKYFEKDQEWHAVSTLQYPDAIILWASIPQPFDIMNFCIENNIKMTKLVEGNEDEENDKS